MTARRQNQLKALASELLLQAEDAARRGDAGFSRRRISEARRVLARVGPVDGAQLQARLKRIETTGSSKVPRVPQKTKKVNKSAKLCSDCGVRDASKGGRCDGCAVKQGFKSCVSCLRLYQPSRKKQQPLVNMCPKCRGAGPRRSNSDGSRSVRTVSGGLPTLGRRR